MKMILLLALGLMLGSASWAQAAGDYRGDERCPLPKDWSNYSEPYQPTEHPYEFPTFYKADWHGWSCSYKRDDGVIVQYGDSRTPQEQWLATWGSNDDN